MDIDYLIDRLEALVQTGKRVPLSNKVMVDEQECYALIDQMRAVVPEEVKAAKRTLADRDHILDEAEETARHTIQQAEREREQMLEREGLLVEAERQRDLILNEAAQEAFELNSQAQAIYDDAVHQTQEMREGANQYAMQVLQELETLLDKHLNVVRNGMQNFIQQSQQYQQQIDEYQRQYRPAAPHQDTPGQSRASTTRRPAEPPSASGRPTPTRHPAPPQPVPPTGRPAGRAMPEPPRPAAAQSDARPDEFDDFETGYDEEPTAPRPAPRRDSPYGPGPGQRPARPPF